MCKMWRLPENGNLRNHWSSCTIWVFRWLHLIPHIVTFLYKRAAPSQTYTLCQGAVCFHHHQIQMGLRVLDSFFHSVFIIVPRKYKSHSHCTVFIPSHSHKALIVSDTVADWGCPSTKEQSVIVLMWFLWYCVFHQKLNHVSTVCCVQT